MKINIFDFVLAAVLALVIGVAFLGWIQLYSLVRPFLAPLGLKYTMSGVWLIGGLLPPLIIRKPGVALFAELLAGTVEAFGSQWGFSACAWGFVQGFGAELVFAFFLYRRWNFCTVALAAMLSALFSYAFGYFYYGYSTLTTAINVMQLLTFELSAVALGALPSWYFTRRLVKAGVLNNFKIVRDSARRFQANSSQLS